ncbi:MAG: polyprenyl synthetase family protein [Candidatus Omnitrophota bacterium]
MYFKIKKRLDKELSVFIKGIDRSYALKKLSPILSKEIKGFVRRKGKRLRPILFIVGYLGFAKTVADNLYRSALSLELLHDFLLIHDDIIDKSDMRRGKPSLHKKFDGYLSGHKGIKFAGVDLAIVAGDIIYAIAIDSFLSIKENAVRKEKALKNFLQTTIYTGAGEFVELLAGIKDIKNIRKSDIYKIYDLKTAFYSFASPLSTGAILAGASNAEVKKLNKSAIYLGEAFQIKDDILGMFAEENEIGKPSITDLREGKKTILIWYAYHNAKKSDKNYIRYILSKKKVGRADLYKMRRILTESGALSYAQKEISILADRGLRLLDASRMRPKYKAFLLDYSRNLLKI